MKNYILVLCVALLVGCSDSSDPPVKEGAKRTVLAYLIADNGNNDLSPYVLSDFAEMVEGMSAVNGSDCNLLVYCETKKDFPHLIHLKKINRKVVVDTIRTYPEQNPLSKTVMSGIIDYVFEQFPAESYGMILASHGEGWISSPSSPNARWFGDYRSSYMNISDLRDVLQNFPKLDFLFFDACFMQAVEVVYELRDCAEYIISSPTEIPGPGAPYQNVVPVMFANKADVGIDIAKAYYDYYKDYNGLCTINGIQDHWTYGVSVSAIKTSELEALASVTKSLLSQYVSDGEYINVSSLLYYDRSYTCYYYDFDGLMHLVCDGDNNYLKWRTAFDKAQPYFKTTPTNYARGKGGSFDMTSASGLSIYIPRNNSAINSFYRTTEWYINGGWAETGW